jgi:hypothetical protein
MKKIVILLLSAGFFLQSCELIEDSTGLSEEQVIEGLKTALNVGADSATTNLHTTNGYFLDETVKIVLPPDAEIITNNLSKVVSYIPGGQSFIEGKLDDLVLSLNKAAEDAADDALPILTSAVTNLSIQEAWDILNGTVPTSTKSTQTSEFDSTAATNYLSQQTKDDLIIAFSTPINASLNKNLVGNTSTNDIWSSITTYYNDAVVIYNAIPFFTDLDQVNSDLGEYATEKALDGLFLKVGEEEKKIRKDPYAWAIDILEDVFGSLL